MPTLDPVYWISTPIFPYWGTKSKFIIPMIKYNRSKSLDWNYTRFLPDDVNYTNEKYYTPARMDNSKVNCSSDISHSLSSVPYNKWWLYPWDSSHDADNFLVGGQDVQTGWDFWFQTSCSELPPDSWSADPIENVDYRENGFNKWETHWYRMSIKLGNGTFIHTEFSNDGTYIQKYSLNGVPCHGAGSIDIGSTLQYYKPYQDGMFAIVGLYKEGFDPENPDPDYIEDFAIITNVNHPSSYEWNYFRLYGWENFEFHHEDDPDTPEPPTEEDMKIKTPFLGQWFNRQYLIRRSGVEALARNIAQRTGQESADSGDDWWAKLNARFGGYSGWIENIIDICIFPIDLYSIVPHGDGEQSIDLSAIDGTLEDNWAYISISPYLAYKVNGSTDVLIDATSWTLIQRKYNDFRDFPPFRRSRVHLPFCGVVDIDLSKYYGKYMKVKYSIDIANGGCRAFVCIASSNTPSDDGIIIATYEGQVGYHTPVGGVNYTEYMNQLNSSVSNAITSGINMGVTGAENKLGQGMQKALSKVNPIEMSVQAVEQGIALNRAETSYPLISSGSPSPCLNMYDDYSCWFIWYETDTSESSNLLQLQGYPSNKSGTLQSFSGFLSVTDVKLVCPKATERERNSIKQMLTSGVYI